MNIHQLQQTIDSFADNFRRSPREAGQTYGLYTAHELVERREFSGCSEMAMMAQYVLTERGIQTRILLTASIATLRDLIAKRETPIIAGHQYLITSSIPHTCYVVDPIHRTILPNASKSLHRYDIIRCPQCPEEGMMIYDVVDTMPTHRYGSLDDLIKGIKQLAKDELAQCKLAQPAP